MNLEQLQVRSNELQNALIQTTQQMYVIQGHKQEVDYQIQVIVEAEAAEALANPPEAPVE